MDRLYLEYIEEDENKQLREFYEENLTSLENHTIGDIKHEYVKEITAIVFDTSLCKESDWKVLANDLGINNNRIKHIATDAHARQVSPVYIVLAEELASKSYAHLIDTLLKREKYNILKYLKDYTRELLKHNCVSEADVDHGTLEFNAEQQTRTTSSSGEPNYKLTTDCFNGHGATQHNTYVPYAANGHIKLEFNPLQLSHGNRLYETERLILNSLVQNGPFFEGNLSQRVDISPSAPRLSVFIQHTESDTDIAKELSSMLREAGFCVKAMFEMDVVEATDQTKALVMTFQEVDFVVPIVSDKLLEQFQFPESSDDAKGNKTLYDCIMNEYSNNDCLNLRTRPVIMPQMDRQYLMEDARWTILAFSFRLWKEVPKLITVMRKTIEFASSLKALKGSKKKNVKGMQ